MTSNIQMLTAKTNENLTNLSRFIVEQNLCHHSNGESSDDYQDLVSILTQQEIRTKKDSSIFIIENEAQQIAASIRILKWNYKDMLPIEELFGIKPLDIIGNTMLKHVWHIGRLAIRKEVKDLSLFKKLIACALTPVYAQPNSIVFAECDEKLIRVMRALGIDIIQVGEGVKIVGSVKVPICIYSEGLVKFYDKNKNLVPENVLKAFKINELMLRDKSKSYNYPLV
ncbi:conserved protein of unknown function [Tenacibaculum sp. 190130A14a]|uniref:Uncharacterized protein n=1 Tax=Tenacibaculum polynesiense TaxID=3137857 RepID=A0ABP1F5X9_9FLAO